MLKMALEEGKEPVTVRTSRILSQKIVLLLGLFFVLGIGIPSISMYMIQYFGIENVITYSKSSFQGCFEEPDNLEKWIRPPFSLMHNMSDKELLWRASFVPKVKKYPFNRVPKIAFMFLTRGPLPLAPIWEKFLKGHKGFYSIYIHSLPSYRPNFARSSVFYQRQIPSQITEWGRMSLCDAERRLLANALLDISNERFVLVSESCVPLFNFTIVYNYLVNSRYSYMGAFDDKGPFGRGRYNPRMEPEVSITDWRKASQWFEVNRKLAVAVVEDTKFYPKFEEFCRPACYVDEHYFPTLLTIRAPNLLANRTITWVDWSRGGPHPATFGKADITEEFLTRIRQGHSCDYNDQPSSVCFLFARKFAPSTLDPLLKFAPKILEF
ncbi:hypothetical protein C5167_020166 [Papaver somniferum]|uniref:Uncharacterized protein n=1 Tax=Papaver somniferum TaxID=3469 RepID=A0A4Y7ISR8_PAPSO|nr:uncharacterized protein LOC113349477 [Papaver somniferum]RZC51737.1 hypothetical protein C5167_020166 [Papaver somniferum]